MIQLDVVILLGAIPIFALALYEHFEKKGPNR